MLKLLATCSEVFCTAAGEINESEFNKTNPYVIGVSLFAIAFAGVAGSAFAIYKEVLSIEI